MMAIKPINVDIDMCGNTVRDICIESVTELPAGTENRIVLLTTVNELYVFRNGEWTSAGQINPFENVMVNGEIIPIVDKAVNIPVPTKTSDISNDSGYIDRSVAELDNFYTKAETYTRTEVDRKISEIKQFDYLVVDALPETGEWGYIYLVPAGTTKAKNYRDEYIWVNEAWEQIGSTQFNLTITQNVDGISINNTALQDASAVQDGLMTRELVKEFRGKQDTLTPGPGISIKDGVISATGSAGGAGHASFVGEFGGDGQTKYTVAHGLGTYNIVFQIRSVEPPVRYVQAEVEAISEDALKIIVANPLDKRMSISIMACDVVVTPTVFDVDVKEIESPSTVWTYINTTGAPLFVQTFDSVGNEIRGDVVQESADGFDPVVASLQKSESGFMFVAKADKTIEFENESSITIDLASEGLDASSRYAVQVYLDGTGQAMGDVVQENGSITVEFTKPLSGYIVLRKASVVQEFTGATEITVDHGLNRKVGVQVYLNGTGQAMIDVQQTPDDDIVEISVNDPLTGYIIVI